jgi:hypothetical protein
MYELVAPAFLETFGDKDPFNYKPAVLTVVFTSGDVYRFHVEGAPSVKRQSLPDDALETLKRTCTALSALPDTAILMPSAGYVQLGVRRDSRMGDYRVMTDIDDSTHVEEDGFVGTFNGVRAALGEVLDEDRWEGVTDAEAITDDILRDWHSQR